MQKVHNNGSNEYEVMLEKIHAVYLPTGPMNIVKKHPGITDLGMIAETGNKRMQSNIKKR